MNRWIAIAAAFAATLGVAHAAEIKVMTTGAPKSVVQAVAEAYAKANGHTIALVQDTAGGVRRRVEAGEAADVIVATPEVLEALVKSGKASAGTQVDFARTGVGVGVRDGVARPDIATVDAFKRFLTAAPAIAMPDPKAGGTSAIYIEGLIQRLGLADIVKPKAKLKAGGYAADLVVEGQADYVIHQISEIIPVKGVSVVGPLPAEIQLITVYSASLSPAGAASEAARGLMAALGGAPGRAAATAAGMDPMR